MHAKLITYQFDGLALALVTFSALALLRFCSCSASLLACCARVCLDWTVCSCECPTKKKTVGNRPEAQARVSFAVGSSVTPTLYDINTDARE